MRLIVQVEHRSSLLDSREALLADFGLPVLSLLGTKELLSHEFGNKQVAVLVLGHGIPWEEREQLATVFGDRNIPVVALLRSSDEPIRQATINCRADDVPAWLQAIAKITKSIH